MAPEADATLVVVPDPAAAASCKLSLAVMLKTPTSMMTEANASAVLHAKVFLWPQD
jgi:hypothetical protein